MIGDLKPQKLVDSRQCFFVLYGDPYSTAAINVFIPILHLPFQCLKHRHARWDVVMDEHRRFEVTSREHAGDMG